MRPSRTEADSRAYVARAIAAPGNRASARVLEKAGFRRMGVEYRYRYAKGHWWDMERFTLEHAEWRLTAETPP